MDNSVEFDDISKITRFIKDQQRISLSDAHKIIKQFIDGKIDYEYGCYLCLGYDRVLPSCQDMLSNLNHFFNKIDFNTRDKVNEKQFFLDMLDFMHDLMFKLAFVSDTNENADFNLFFMYRERKMKIPADINPSNFYKSIEYGEVISSYPSGCLYKILSAIPQEYLKEDGFKQKLKRIADDSLKVLDGADRAHYGLIVPYLSLKIYLYKKYDLAASRQDVRILFNEWKEELDSIKNGLRKSSWPRNIIFEKHMLYDMSAYFKSYVDEVDEKIADVVRSAIIYCRVQDFSEDDFKWYSENFETDFKNKTEIKVDEDGQPLKNLFLDEIDSIGYYKLKFIVDSNFIIFDENRLNDEKFKPFSEEDFDSILNAMIRNKITFINQYVKDGMFCVLCHMLKNITRDQFYDTVKILFDITNVTTVVIVGGRSNTFTVGAAEYIDYLYDKYMCKEGKYRPDLKGCLDAIHCHSLSEYQKYKEELEKKRKEDLEKERIETEKKKKQHKKQKSEKIKHNGDSISGSEEESESNEEKKEKKKNKRKDIKEKEKNQTKRSKCRKKKNFKENIISDNEESSSDSEEKSKSDEKKRQKVKVKKSYEEEESESQSSESEDNEKKKYKSNVKRKNSYKSDNSSDEEDNDEKEKNKKKKHKHHKEESSSNSEEESKSNEKEKGKKKNKLKNIKFKEKFDENTKKKLDKKKINKHKHRKKENKSESENESEEKIKKKKIRQTKSKEENKSDKERIETEKKIVQDKKIIKTEILVKDEESKLNPKKENGSIEKGESSNTDKKDYSGSIKYNSVALDSQNTNDNDNEIIAQSCDGEIKINTEQDNSSNANNDAKIQTNETRISNKNAYDQTKENPPSSQDNKNKKLKWTFGIIGTVLFILAFILFFTLALSLAVKIIIALAILIFSMVCFVIVYKIRKLEPPQNLNNGNIVNSEQSFLNNRQKKNEKGQNRVSDKINQENKTEYGSLVETK